MMMAGLEGLAAKRKVHHALEDALHVSNVVDHPLLHAAVLRQREVGEVLVELYEDRLELMSLQHPVAVDVYLRHIHRLAFHING